MKPESSSENKLELGLDSLSGESPWSWVESPLPKDDTIECGSIFLHRNRCEITDHHTAISWKDSEKGACESEIVRQHLANVVDMEGACTDFDRPRSKPYCRRVVRCAYSLKLIDTSNEGVNTYIDIEQRITIVDRRALVDRTQLFRWGKRALSAGDVLGRSSRFAHALRRLGGGKSGAEKFVSADNSVIIKRMNSHEREAWIQEHAEHGRVPLETSYAARLEPETRSYLARTLGTISVVAQSVESDAIDHWSDWSAWLNVVPGGTRWFSQPVLECDVKPQEMVGWGMTQTDDGSEQRDGQFGYDACTTLLSEGISGLSFEGAEPTKGVAPSNAFVSSASSSLKIMLADLLTLDHYDIVDFSWLLIVVPPRSEMVALQAETFAPLAVLPDSGYFVFLGIIDALQRLTLSRRAESVVKSLRVLSANLRPSYDAEGHVFNVKSAKEMQWAKFFEYPQKQFLLGSIYFLCVDPADALEAWHYSKHPGSSDHSHGDGTQRCNRKFPTPVVRKGEYKRERKLTLIDLYAKI